MKKFYTVLLFLAGVLTLPAQTNMNTNAVNAILALVTTNSQAAPPEKKPPAMPKPHGPMTISSVGPLVIDMNNHWLVYRDHVSVTDPQAKLTCEWLEANIPQNGEHATNIVALTNVVIDFTDDKGQKIHAIGEKAVYFYHVENSVTNDTVTLTGNPQVTMGPGGQDKTTGDKIVWDRMTGQYAITNPKGIFSQDAGRALMTNSPAMKTNLPTLNPLPQTSTNSPASTNGR
jgi:lipopolysaccharide export system protein LptA